MALSTSREMDFKARAVLCDSAATAEGKLYVQGGGWSLLTPPQYPFQAPRMGLAVTIDVPYTRTNQPHVMTIELKNEDGEDFVVSGPPGPMSGATEPVPIRAEGNFTLGRPPQLQAGEVQVLPFAVNFDGLIFDHPGSFYFLICVDGQEIERATFRAAPATLSKII